MVPTRLFADWEDERAIPCAPDTWKLGLGGFATCPAVAEYDRKYFYFKCVPKIWCDIFDHHLLA